MKKERLQIIKNEKEKAYVLIDMITGKCIIEHENLQVVENKQDDLQWYIQLGLPLNVR